MPPCERPWTSAPFDENPNNHPDEVVPEFQDIVDAWEKELEQTKEKSRKAKQQVRTNEIDDPKYEEQMKLIKLLGANAHYSGDLMRELEAQKTKLEETVTEATSSQNELIDKQLDSNINKVNSKYASEIQTEKKKFLRYKNAEAQEKFHLENQEQWQKWAQTQFHWCMIAEQVTKQITDDLQTLDTASDLTTASTWTRHEFRMDQFPFYVLARKPQDQKAVRVCKSTTAGIIHETVYENAMTNWSRKSYQREQAAKQEEQEATQKRIAQAQISIDSPNPEGRQGTKRGQSRSPGSRSPTERQPANIRSASNPAKPQAYEMACQTVPEDQQVSDERSARHTDTLMMQSTSQMNSTPQNQHDVVGASSKAGSKGRSFKEVDTQLQAMRAERAPDYSDPTRFNDQTSEHEKKKINKEWMAKANENIYKHQAKRAAEVGMPIEQAPDPVYEEVKFGRWLELINTMHDRKKETQIKMRELADKVGLTEPVPDEYLDTDRFRQFEREIERRLNVPKPTAPVPQSPSPPPMPTNTPAMNSQPPMPTGPPPVAAPNHMDGHNLPQPAQQPMQQMYQAGPVQTGDFQPVAAITQVPAAKLELAPFHELPQKTWPNMIQPKPQGFDDPATLIQLRQCVRIAQADHDVEALEFYCILLEWQQTAVYGSFNDDHSLEHQQLRMFEGRTYEFWLRHAHVPRLPALNIFESLYPFERFFQGRRTIWFPHVQHGGRPCDFMDVLPIIEGAFPTFRASDQAVPEDLLPDAFGVPLIVPLPEGYKPASKLPWPLPGAPAAIPTSKVHDDKWWLDQLTVSKYFPTVQAIENKVLGECSRGTYDSLDMNEFPTWAWFGFPTERGGERANEIIYNWFGHVRGFDQPAPHIGESQLWGSRAEGGALLFVFSSEESEKTFLEYLYNPTGCQLNEDGQIPAFTMTYLGNQWNTSSKTEVIRSIPLRQHCEGRLIPEAENWARSVFRRLGTTWRDMRATQPGLMNGYLKAANPLCYFGRYRRSYPTEFLDMEWTDKKHWGVNLSGAIVPEPEPYIPKNITKIMHEGQRAYPCKEWFSCKCQCDGKRNPDVCKCFSCECNCACYQHDRNQRGRICMDPNCHKFRYERDCIKPRIHGCTLIADTKNGICNCMAAKPVECTDRKVSHLPYYRKLLCSRFALLERAASDGAIFSVDGSILMLKIVASRFANFDGSARKFLDNIRLTDHTKGIDGILLEGVSVNNDFAYRLDDLIRDFGKVNEQGEHVMEQLHAQSVWFLTDQAEQWWFNKITNYFHDCKKDSKLAYVSAGGMNVPPQYVVSWIRAIMQNQDAYKYWGANKRQNKQNPGGPVFIDLARAYNLAEHYHAIMQAGIQAVEEFRFHRKHRDTQPQPDGFLPAWPCDFICPAVSRNCTPCGACWRPDSLGDNPQRAPCLIHLFIENDKYDNDVDTQMHPARFRMRTTTGSYYVGMECKYWQKPTEAQPDCITIEDDDDDTKHLACDPVLQQQPPVSEDDADDTNEAAGASASASTRRPDRRVADTRKTETIQASASAAPKRANKQTDRSIRGKPQKFRVRGSPASSYRSSKSPTRYGRNRSKSPVNYGRHASADTRQSRRSTNSPRPRGGKSKGKGKKSKPVRSNSSRRYEQARHRSHSTLDRSYQSRGRSRDRSNRSRTSKDTVSSKQSSRSVRDGELQDDKRAMSLAPPIASEGTRGPHSDRAEAHKPKEQEVRQVATTGNSVIAVSDRVEVTAMVAVSAPSTSQATNDDQ